MRRPAGTAHAPAMTMTRRRPDGPLAGSTPTVTAVSSEPSDRLHSGSASQFVAAIEAHRREIHTHCYRMVGSHHTAEDLVQETFIRAWRARATFEGRSTLRAWLYRIATNICLDVLRRDPYRIQLVDAAAIAGGRSFDKAAWPSAWLAELPAATTGDSEPEAAVVSRETVETALLAAVEHLPPRQRAALVLRDGLGWTARETAQAIETTVAGANSALQRARATLRQWALYEPERPPEAPTPDELEALTRCLGVITSYTDVPAFCDPLPVRELLDL
jgi:RNA polymerase sigma-70 factor, ECF subfamily